MSRKQMSSHLILSRAYYCLIKPYYCLFLLAKRFTGSGYQLGMNFAHEGYLAMSRDILIATM